MKVLLFTFIFCFTFALPASADTDTGLYAPITPKDKAFIREIIIDENQPLAVGDYQIIDSGEVRSGVTIEPQNFYTILVRDEVTIFEDQKIEDPTKAVIAFYNLSMEEGVSLKTADGQVMIFDEIFAMESTSRAINAAKIDLQLYKDGTHITEIPNVILERQNHYSVIYDGTNAQVIHSKIARP